MKRFLYFLLCLFLTYNVSAQVGINTDNSDPDASAMLDIKSTNKGILIPRMSSTERQQIMEPAVGLMVYDSTAQAFYYFNGMGWLELLSGSVTLLADADNDTKIQVEEGVDEDMIRFDIAGEETWRMNGTRLEPSNEGKGIFIGESAGANDSLLTESSPGNFISTSNIFLGYKSGEQSGTGLYNIGIGEETLNLGDSMLANIGIGYQSLSNTHLSVGNVGIGLRSLYKLEDGEVNIALGYNAVSNLTKGNGNVAIGALTMGIAKEGNRNVALGYEAMGENLELENNVAIGYRAGYGDDNTVSTTNNVWIGNRAGFYSEGSGNVFLGSSVGASYSWRNFNNRLAIDNSSTNTPLLYGEFDNDLLRINGTLNINNAFSFPTADGTIGQLLQTDGSGNITWASVSGINTLNNLSDADNNTKIQVEESADEDKIRFDVNGIEALVIHQNTAGETLLEIPNSQFNTFFGVDAGAVNVPSATDGKENSFFGHSAGKVNTTGEDNTFIGANAGTSNTTGDRNTFVGNTAGDSNSTGTLNVFIGDEAGRSNTNGWTNTFLGTRAGVQSTIGNENVFLGSDAGSNNTSGSYNTYIGTYAGQLNETGQYNIALGFLAGGSNETGNDNIFIGKEAGYNELGSNKLYIENSNADSTNALIYGEFDNDLLRINGALNINNAFSFPTADGTTGQVLQTDGSGSLTWTDAASGGIQTLIEDTDNDTKIQVEESADEDIIRFDINGLEKIVMTSNLEDISRLEFHNNKENIAIGIDAGKSLNGDLQTTFGSNNIGLGNYALMNTTGGNENVAIGSYSLVDNTTGFSNTAIGYGSLRNHQTGNNNIAMGFDAGYWSNGGNNNIYIGYNAGFGLGAHTKENNVMVGHQSGYKTKSNGNVFLGYHAGYNETNANRLYIENSNSTSPLLYGEFDNDLLRINGTLNINNTFSFPTTDGAANQVLKTDGAGNLSWANDIDTNTDTDDQTIDVLNLNGTSLEVSLENDGQATKTVDLSGLAVPVGTIMMWATNTPPTGWVLCDGASITAYPQLVTVLGSNNAPNLEDRFPYGAGSLKTLGQSGGSDSVALSEANIPEHSHDSGTLKTTYDYKSNNSSAGSASNKDGSDVQFYNGNAITGNTGTWGGSSGFTQPFSILPPFLALNFIIKAE